jgi:pyruvate carboxylase
MSGTTSRPSLGAVVAALKGSKNSSGVDLEEIMHSNDYR